MKAIVEQFVEEYSNAYSPLGVYREGGIEIENFVLHAIVVQPKYELPTAPGQGMDPGAALAGKRPVYWEEYGDFSDTNVYRGEDLGNGNVVVGPAVIEFGSTTVVLPPGTTYTVDEHLNGEIERSTAQV